MRYVSSADHRDGRCRVRHALSSPFSFLRTRLLPLGQIIATGLLVSACASAHSSYDRPAHMGANNTGWTAPRVAVAAPPKVVEMEDDGLAVQAPPRKRKHAEPDDPSEPFSRNYGPAPEGVEPARVEPRPMRKAEGVPPVLRSRATPMSPAEVQTIISAAMVAHELRNP